MMRFVCVLEIVLFVLLYIIFVLGLKGELFLFIINIVLEFLLLFDVLLYLDVLIFV